jgi:glycosyltransferase involved in cell wall biosynthesis
MNIGYFTHTHPYKNPITGEMIKEYTGGGVGNVSYNIAVEMAKRGHEVYVFTSSIDSKESVENYENIIIYRYKKSFTIGSTPIPIDILYKPLKRGINLDIVHAHAGNPPAPIAAYWYAKKKKKPFVVTYHGDGQWDRGGAIRRMSVYFYNKYILNKILSYADVIISPSKYYIDESRVLDKYGDKIVAVPNGINIDEFDINYSKVECRTKLDLPVDSNIVLFLGTLGPQKGPDILLKTIPKILRVVSNVIFIFAGGGIMREELEKLSKKLGVEKNVRFAGFVEEDIKPLYYRAADVFCLPSVMTSEVFPIVFLEASASGLPMVVSDLDTFKCVIEDGYNGIVAKRNDVNNLADVIIYLLENEDVRERMGKNARKKVEDYSWNRVAEETEKVYLSLTE